MGLALKFARFRVGLKLMKRWIGSRDPDNVLSEYADRCSKDEDEAGIRKAQICKSDWGGGYAYFPKSCGIPGSLLSHLV